MEQLIQYMKEIIEMVEKTAELFYQQRQQDGLQKLEQMIVGIMALLEEIQAYRKDQAIIILDEAQFNQILTNAMEVLARQDYVLLADILTFELNVAVENALNELRLYAKVSQ